MGSSTIVLDRATLQTVYEQLRPVARGQMADGTCSAGDRQLIETTGIDLFLTAADLARWTGAPPGFTHQGRWYGGLSTLRAVYAAAVTADRSDGQLDGRIPETTTTTTITTEKDTRPMDWQTRLQPYLDSIFAVRHIQHNGRSSSGTAWIVEQETIGAGRYRHWLITNAHVVDSAGVVTNDYAIELKDSTGSRRQSLTFQGIDYEHDIAVLSFDSTTPLTPLPVATAQPLRVGDPLMIVGNQLGNGIVLTEGKINAIDKYANEWNLPMLQDDSSALPGNSGSPAFDVTGHVVGVCNSGQESGENYNIPARHVMASYRQIKATGSAAHGYLGIRTTFVDERTLRAMGVPEGSHGFFVRLVHAVAAGTASPLQRGDVIIAYEGQPIPSDEQQGRFWDDIRQRTPGSLLALRVYRGGKPLEVRVPIAQDIARKPQRLQTEFGFLLREIDPIDDARHGFPIADGGLMMQTCYATNTGRTNCRDDGLLTSINQSRVRSIAAFLQVTRGSSANDFVFHYVVPTPIGLEENIRSYPNPTKQHGASVGE